ncbi:hypothetical protein DL768_003424 [Monosporascus sp. mg162]|nr:hypothetical protein DL768_003424 [Monosporascus sp. mg162]
MEPIAIVGLSFRLPGDAEDEASLWEMLEHGRNVMTAWPESRANVEAFYDPDTAKTNTLYSKGAHFVKGDPAAFDAPFFSITSKEAASMDPQQRWLLEATYRAIENAGIPAEKLAGSETSVFAASMADDYMRLLTKDPDESPANIATGISQSILANRLSCPCAVDKAQLFDHRANGFARGEGVIVFVLKRLTDAARDGDMIRAVIRGTGSNQDGHTPGITQPSAVAQEHLIRKVYSSCNLGFGSTRYVEAHGTGTQIGDSTEMKALGRIFRSSRSSKDPLYVGSIKANIGHLEGGSGLAGILKSIQILERGIIPPNPLFEKVNPKINAKFYNIQVPTSCIRWPTEGLRRVSVNSFGFGGSNGHIILDDAYHTLEALSYKSNHQTLTWSVSTIPITNREKSNGNMAVGKFLNGDRVRETRQDDKLLNGKPSEVLDNLESEVPALNNTPLKAISEVYDSTSTTDQTATPTPTQSSSKYQLLIWSAKDEAALKRVLQQYTKYYESPESRPNDRLELLAYTLAARRSAMPWRSFAVLSIDSTSEAISTSGSSNAMRSSRDLELAFIFTGQGAQYQRMGLDLLQYPVFRSVLERVDKVFSDLGAQWSLSEEIQHAERINSPEFSQPLCTALQIALVELLKSFNVIPAAVVGHSSGEIAAAYTVGALSLESACKVAYHRGRLAAQLAASTPKPGAMMSVNLAEGDVDAYLTTVLPSAEIYVACVNSPANVTLSGDETDIDLVKKYLDNDGIFAHKLKTAVAYHSPAMKQISGEYLSCLGSLERGQPVTVTSNILMVSSVTGESIPLGRLSKSQYWVDNLVSPVRFADALQYLVLAAPKADGLKPISDYLEVGPHAALRRPTNDTLSQVAGRKNSRYSSMLSKFETPLKSSLETVGWLFARGYPVSVIAANQHDTGVDAPPFLANLPSYPFDHSQLYWHETRLSRDWRLREATPRSLLGTRTLDWNPLEPRWRKMLSIEETPWIGDHVVGGTVFFPGTGIMMMALEAVRQTAQGHKRLSGYYIKEATFANPIVVRPDARTEVVTQLRPLQQAYEKESWRSEVRIFSYVDSYWSECFKAVIHTEYEEAPTEVDGGREARATARRLVRDYEEAKSASVNLVDSEDFYKWHREQGIQYGEAFRLANDIYWDGGEIGVARVDVSPPIEPFEGVVHPAVLDASCQVCFAAPSNGMSKALPTIIPHKMQDTWLAATGWQYPQTRQIRMLTTSKFKAAVSGLECSFTALADDGSPLIYVKHLEMLPVINNESTGDAGRNLLHAIDWRPQLSLMSPEQLHGYCQVDTYNDESGTVDYCIRLERALRTVIQRNLGRLLKTDWPKAPPHMRKYVAWMERQLTKTPGRTAEEVSDEELREELKGLREERPSWRVFIEIAEDLCSIVSGDTDALELLFSTPLIKDLYDEFFGAMYNHKIISYLQLAAHQRPNQKILEVGAGTGALTSHIFSTLESIEDQTGGIAFSEFVYTDISPAFFDGARELFSKHKDRMIFKTLDLERDIISQGFEPATYDMIIAGSVLHATKNLTDTLRNLWRALKPGGQLVFHETTAEDCFVMNFGFGILSGWWASEEESRAWAPTISELEWDALLRETGYSGNDLVIRDYEHDAAHYASFIVSTARDPCRTSLISTGTLFVVDGDDGFQRSVASLLSTGILNSPDQPSKIIAMTRLAEANMGSIDYVVFLAEMGKSFLAGISESGFRSIQSLVQLSKNLLWVTSSDIYRGCSGSTPYPYSGMKDGFLRVLRSEFGGKRIVSLSLEDEALDASTPAEHIRSIFKAAFELGSPEVEYIVRNGQVLTGRLVEEADMNKELNSSIFSQTETAPWLPGPPLKLDIATRGSLETLRFVEDANHYTALGPMEVEIEARAWGVNFRDIFNALGRLGEEGFGSDCAGTVTRVGSDCSLVRPGDRVCMAAVGCMRMFPRAEEWAVVKIPDSVSFEEACAVNNPGITAWHSLVDVARLQKGEKVLIHAASGATGQLAIQVAKLVGAEVFATVGYDHKKQLLIDEYGIPEDHIFYSRDTSFAKGIMRITDGQGVDVVLNSLVGKGLLASWECIAPYGRFIEIGKADILANSSLPMACFAKNVSFSAVDLRDMSFHRKEATRKLFVKTMELAREGTIHCPKPLHTYGVPAVEEAFRYFQSGRNTGRIIIKIDPSTEVQDSVFDNMTYSQWERTIGSKVQSSWNLHTLLPENLDFFILLSSIAGVAGTIGQSNYAAGCAFQDALARYRTANNLKSLSIDLGVMQNVGVVAETESLQKTFEQTLSITQIEEKEFLALLDMFCDPTRPLPPGAKSQVTMGIATPIDFLKHGLEPLEILYRPLFSHFSQPRGLLSNGSGTAIATNYAALFRQSDSAEERASIVVESLAKKLARALSIQPEDVDADKPLHVFGVDSLVAVELRNWIGKEFAADVPVFEIMGGRTVAAVGELVTRTSQIRNN